MHAAQARIHSEEFGVSCPAGSELGTVSLNVPTLPDGSLTGDVYLGGPRIRADHGPPYTMYVVANSARYGVSVRLKGEVVPNEATGPADDGLQRKPRTAVHQPDDPLQRAACSRRSPTRWSAVNANGHDELQSRSTGGTSAAITDASFGVSVTGCASPIPFSLTQSTEYCRTRRPARTRPTRSTSARADGQQYLKRSRRRCPPGLVGEIPAVDAVQRTAGHRRATCPAASKIGTATVTAGSGARRTRSPGTVYLTGPYNGAPFGLAIVVPAVAGPFNLGHVVDARDDQHQPDNRAGDVAKARCRRSSRASRCACARSASTSTGRASCSTRPTADALPRNRR